MTLDHEMSTSPRSSPAWDEVIVISDSDESDVEFLPDIDDGVARKCKDASSPKIENMTMRQLVAHRNFNGLFIDHLVPKCDKLFSTQARIELKRTPIESAILYEWNKRTSDISENFTSLKGAVQSEMTCLKQQVSRSGCTPPDITTFSQAVKRRRISEQCQAVSTPVELLEFLHIKSEAKEIKSTNPKLFQKHRITDERQAFSSPAKTESSLLCSCSRGASDTAQIGCSKSGEKSTCLDNAHCICGSITCDCVASNEPQPCYGSTKTTYIEETRTIPNENCLSVQELMRRGISLGMAYLERNIVLGSLCFSNFLPSQSVYSSKKRVFNFYHTSCVQTALEDGNISAAVDFLWDYASTEIPHIELIPQLLRAISLKREQTEFHELFLTRVLIIWQKNPEIISLSEDHVLTILSSTSQMYSLLMLIVEGLQLSLFTNNLCDLRELRYSIPYQILSWNKGRSVQRQIICSLGDVCGECGERSDSLQWSTEAPSVPLCRCASIESCRNGLDGEQRGFVCHHVIHRLTQLQRMLSLGLLSTKDPMDHVTCVAKEVSDLYMSLTSGHQRHLLLSTLELPLLILSVTRRLLQENYLQVGHLADTCPTLEKLMQNFKNALPNGHESDKRIECEELSILFYFMVYSSLECTKWRVYESERERLLHPGLGGLVQTVEELGMLHQHVKDFSQHLLHICPVLSETTKLHLHLIECLIGAFLPYT